MLRTLIVEDNPVNYMIMRNQLAKQGIQADVCYNGQEAMDYCIKNGMPELIMLDGYMPEMCGIEFLKWIRNYPGGDAPYILFCSSSIDVIDVSEAMRLGADSYYPKPITQEYLKAVLALVAARTTAPIVYKQS